MFDWSDCSEVTASPETVSGAFVFRGTRVPVKALFENLEDGATVDDFIQWFPGVGREQVDAVLEFAVDSLAPSRLALRVTCGHLPRVPMDSGVRCP